MIFSSGITYNVVVYSLGGAAYASSPVSVVVIGSGVTQAASEAVYPTVAAAE